MTSTMLIINNKGFIALIAVILLSGGVLAFVLVTASSAFSYRDMVTQRELRIQSRLDAFGCLDTLALMLAKDYFLNGSLYLKEFGCTATVSNPYTGVVNVRIIAELYGVKSYGNMALNVTDGSVIVNSREVY